MNSDNTQYFTDLDRAKQVVMEIIRCAGGAVDSKIKLFKIFYFAHLNYAQDNPDYLSEWPIVRMPLGPGIDNANRIFESLKRDGLLEERQVSVGPYPSFEYRAVKDEMTGLSPDAIEAIRKAVEFAADKSAADLSEITHEFSNSWKNSPDGQTLNIYVDLVTEETYLDMKRRAAEDASDLAAIMGQTT